MRDAKTSNMSPEMAEELLDAAWELVDSVRLQGKESDYEHVSRASLSRLQDVLSPTAGTEYLSFRVRDAEAERDALKALFTDHSEAVCVDCTGPCQRFWERQREKEA